MEEQRKAKIAFIPCSYRTYDVLILRSYSRSALIPCQNSMFQCERGMSAIKMRSYRVPTMLKSRSERGIWYERGTNEVWARYERGYWDRAHSALWARFEHNLSIVWVRFIALIARSQWNRLFWHDMSAVWAWYECVMSVIWARYERDFSLALFFHYANLGYITARHLPTAQLLICWLKIEKKD